MQPSAQRIALLRRGLPDPHTVRWTALRKASVAAAVSAGVVSAEEAQARYDLSGEELETWVQRFGVFGVDGLKSGRS